MEQPDQIESLTNIAWQQRQTMEILSLISYRTGELSPYLKELACGVSQLLKIDWSVVTLCQDGFEKVLASNINLGEDQQVYSFTSKCSMN